MRSGLHIVLFRLICTFSYFAIVNVWFRSSNNLLSKLNLIQLSLFIIFSTLNSQIHIFESKSSQI